MASTFRLDKWYFDLITEDGSVFIGYLARLRWWFFTFHYVGYVFLDQHQRLQHFHQFRKSPSPTLTTNQFHVQVSNIHGTWDFNQPGVRETLLEGQQGRIEWHVVIPMAKAKVEMQLQQPLRGFGYVEQLSMSIPPWQLPISRLIWGRFISSSDYVVWIRWISSSVPKTLVLHNGTRYDQATIVNDKVHFGECSLHLSNPCCLRTGSIGSTVFDKAGWIKFLFPRSIRSLQENKWRSHGVLQSSSGQSATGWAIHESVDWSR